MLHLYSWQWCGFVKIIGGEKFSSPRMCKYNFLIRWENEVKACTLPKKLEFLLNFPKSLERWYRRVEDFKISKINTFIEKSTYRILLKADKQINRYINKILIPGRWKFSIYLKFWCIHICKTIIDSLKKYSPQYSRKKSFSLKKKLKVLLKTYFILIAHRSWKVFSFKAWSTSFNFESAWLY